MGWTCQHDFKGYCKRVEKLCVPGMKGCTLKGNFIFSNIPEKKEETKKEEVDFATLVRSN